ncbi:MAG: site-specific DNA-methyltransferase [Opitutaceae bacterium]|nr:site-specific DNA-methyltransferase [Opitutaceae bacterium]
MRRGPADGVIDAMLGFSDFGRKTAMDELRVAGGTMVPVLVNEFWTSKQRDGHALHEVSYRACFKPALPRFFISRFTQPGDLVYDPFMGRGTTLLEAALMGRRVAGCDISPLGAVLVGPRLAPPTMLEIETRLAAIPLAWSGEVWRELEVFYHPDTLRELTALRAYFIERDARGEIDAVDRWLRMVAVNRLTGHSKGFFSVYTLPPNQAVTIESQKRINTQRKQAPDSRNVRALLLKKSKQLLGEDLPEGAALGVRGRKAPVLLTRSSDDTPELKDGSVDLVVTSPPFLDVVQYTTDNWLRCWFCGIDSKSVPIWQLRKIEEWEAAMLRVFRELHRIVRPGGWIAFEVGEVRKGTVRLEEHALAVGAAAGLRPACVLINDQDFTKTSNCWGITNDTRGTNTNRIVLFQRA